MTEPDPHWKRVPGEQHHARAYRTGLNWYEGNITKYAERCAHKGQFVDDLLKVLDYATLYLETAEWEDPTQAQTLKFRDISDRLFDLAVKGQEFERHQLKRALA